jgi:hypothetical protein
MRRLALALAAILAWSSTTLAQSSIGPILLQQRQTGSGGISVQDIANYTTSGTIPDYQPNNWYLPINLAATGAGTNPSAGSIRLYPEFIPIALTINNLGVRVTTLSAGGNIQAAIYKNNPTTGRPTGTPLVSTASMSTASVASVSATAALSLQPGLYWFATNCDNATATFGSFGSTSMMAGWMVGSASQSSDFSGATGLMGLTVSQTFGTWPDLTAGSFTEVGSINSIPIVQFEVASVP